MLCMFRSSDDTELAGKTRCCVDAALVRKRLQTRLQLLALGASGVVRLPGGVGAVHTRFSSTQEFA